MNRLSEVRSRVREWIDQRGDAAEIDAFNAYVASMMELYRAATPDPGTPRSDLFARVAAEAKFASRLCEVGASMPGSVPDDVVARLRGDLHSLLAADPLSRRFAEQKATRWERGASDPAAVTLLRQMLTLAEEGR
jgi:hypothetical protein